MLPAHAIRWARWLREIAVQRKPKLIPDFESLLLISYVSNFRCFGAWCRTIRFFLFLGIFTCGLMRCSPFVAFGCRENDGFSFLVPMKLMNKQTGLERFFLTLGMSWGTCFGYRFIRDFRYGDTATIGMTLATSWDFWGLRVSGEIQLPTDIISEVNATELWSSSSRSDTQGCEKLSVSANTILFQKVTNEWLNFNENESQVPTCKSNRYHWLRTFLHFWEKDPSDRGESPSGNECTSHMLYV